MAKLNSVSLTAQLGITIELTEKEARALSGLFGYGVDSFLEVFYAKMGKAYLQEHEEGVRSLHSTIRNVVDGPLADVDKARVAIRQYISNQ